MANLEILARKQRFGLLQQAKASNHWNTPATTSSNFRTLNARPTIIPDPGVTVSNFEWGSASTLLTEYSRKYVDGITGLKYVPFEGEAMKGTLAAHLAAAFQRITEDIYTEDVSTTEDSGTIAVADSSIYEAGMTVTIAGVTFETNANTTIASITDGTHIELSETCDSTETDVALTILYAKVLQPLDSVLDFTNNQGYLYSVAWQNYNAADAGDGFLLEDALLDQFNFEVSNTADSVDRLAKISGRWVGNKLTASQDFTGTWVAIPTTGYYPASTDKFSLDMQIGSNDFGDDIPWRNFRMEINNNVTSDTATTGGRANNYKVAPEIMFIIDIPYNTTTYKALASYKAGDKVIFSFYTNAVAEGLGDGGIKINITDGTLTENPFVYEGDYHALRLSIRPEYPSAGWGTYGMFRMNDSTANAYL